MWVILPKDFEDKIHGAGRDFLVNSFHIFAQTIHDLAEGRCVVETDFNSGSTHYLPAE